MLNLDDYEEITREEFDEMDEAGIRLTNNYNHTEYYFKKKSKDVFENEYIKVTINGYKDLVVEAKEDGGGK